jgi:hypothetical protein
MRHCGTFYLETSVKASLVLHSTLDPNAVADALRRSIDEERRTIFSLTGYYGSSPVLGVVTENTFRLRRRRYWRNDFAPCFYGQFYSETGGSRIEARFDLSPWTRNFMRLWLAGVTILGAPIFVTCLIDLTTGNHYISGDAVVGLIVPPAMILWGFVLPKIGRLFGLGDEQALSDFVQEILAARIEEPVHNTTKQ